MREGLENCLTFSKNFVEELEAIVVGGVEPDLLFCFRLLGEWVGLGASYLVVDQMTGVSAAYEGSIFYLTIITSNIF